MQRVLALALILFALSPVTALAQLRFEEIRPQIIVDVNTRAFRANVIEVTALDPKYPSSLLAAQCEKLAANLGSGIKGLAVGPVPTDPKNPASVFVKAQFSVVGLVEPGKLKIQPILRAFAGADNPFRVEQIGILFEDQSPSDATLKDFISYAVDVHAQAYNDPAIIEYRARLKTQDPSSILVPDFADPNATEPVTTKPKASKQSNKSIPYLAILLGFVSAGALVYFATRRGTRA